MEDTLATVTSIAPAVMADSGPDDVLRAMTGRRKAAILILQMDRRSSARVLSQMRDTELEELAAEIARARDVAPALSAAVLREFGARLVRISKRSTAASTPDANC